MSESSISPRITPYRLIFGTEVFDESRFEGVREEADTHGAVSSAQLFMLPAAGDLLRDLTPPEGGREIVAQVSALLFSAFRYWRHGRRTYRFTESELRDVVALPEPRAEPRPPANAGYVQLPRNLVWARVAEEGAAEPVDGFFWSAPAVEETGAAERLDLLFALGVRAGRPGLSLFDVSLDAPAQLADWATVSARPDGEDFENVLPGGELQGYLAITTGAEALKLAALCFARTVDPGVTWATVEEAGDTVYIDAHG